ncbi:MAG: right-handed parallel beta-helix repeat-containing protein [Fervidobacterium sp.]
MRRIIFGLMLTFLAIGILSYVFNVQPVRAWTGTVYIRADGSIDPLDAPIITYDNITYTLIDNITSYDNGTIVEKDDIVIEGAGFELSGTGYGIGIDLSNRINVTVKNVTIKNFQTGIYLDNSNNTNIIRNNIEKNRCGICFLYSQNNSIQTNNIVANNESGIYLLHSSLNSIFKNNATSNLYAIFLEFSYDNTIFGNNIVNNQYGVWLRGSNDSRFYHNNFIDNSQQVFDWSWDHQFYSPSVNAWDDGYPSGGNYWSDYTGVDTCSGPYQNETGSDGIGDTHYPIFISNSNYVDKYPLKGMFFEFEVIMNNEKYHVEVISNLTVSDLRVGVVLDHWPPYLPFLQVFIEFFTENTINATTFCRTTIPRVILNGTYIVLIDYEEIPAYELPASNTTHAYVYFAHNQTKHQHEIIIVPEFPLTTTLSVLTLATLITTILRKRKMKLLH